MFRTGFGFDVHRLAKGYDLWLGGIKIPHTIGAVGHSDADVLLHAICDALLGAAALGDIGAHFPDTDDKYKGIDSKVLLKEVVDLINNKGFSIGNIDSTVALQQPKIRTYIDEMRSAIANICNVESDRVSVKATTTEKLGFVGKEEGVSAYASVLIFKK
ncbi:MAG: 2-C-methyl-D-erythritol 2,4-cyclodiphosphate synthase [Bacteroidetes bacterium]|nr:MAG: 2-C-methyl-D-erythritol 2,4-cyclodiphosphate synthase [Bacteroidota bacterium]